MLRIRARRPTLFFLPAAQDLDGGFAEEVFARLLLGGLGEQPQDVT